MKAEVTCPLSSLYLPEESLTGYQYNTPSTCTRPWLIRGLVDVDRSATHPPMPSRVTSCTLSPNPSFPGLYINVGPPVSTAMKTGRPMYIPSLISPFRRLPELAAVRWGPYKTSVNPDQNYLSCNVNEKQSVLKNIHCVLLLFPY